MKTLILALSLQLILSCLAYAEEIKIPEVEQFTIKLEERIKTFAESAKAVDNIIGKAKELSNKKEFDAAIKLLNDSITSYATHGTLLKIQLSVVLFSKGDSIKAKEIIINLPKKEYYPSYEELKDEALKNLTKKNYKASIAFYEKYYSIKYKGKEFDRNDPYFVPDRKRNIFKEHSTQ